MGRKLSREEREIIAAREMVTRSYDNLPAMPIIENMARVSSIACLFITDVLSLARGVKSRADREHAAEIVRMAEVLLREIINGNREDISATIMVSNALETLADVKEELSIGTD